MFIVRRNLESSLEVAVVVIIIIESPVFSITLMSILVYKKGNLLKIRKKASFSYLNGITTSLLIDTR